MENKNTKSLRKNLPYGNRSVYSPDGKLMFRCSDKKANWYLTRNLAIIDLLDPLKIQLTFIPKGRGERCEALKTERWNKCAVCGCEDIEKLTKHHLVPRSFRKHFPEEFKKHRSLLIVPICRECHDIYEEIYAEEIKSKYISQDKNLSIIRDYRKISGYANAILNESNIPPVKKEYLLNDLILLCSKYDIKLGKDIYKSLQDIINLCSINTTGDKELKIVVDAIIKENRLESFERQWVKHFIDTMNPKFIPQEIIKELNSINLKD